MSGTSKNLIFLFKLFNTWWIKWVIPLHFPKCGSIWLQRKSLSKESFLQQKFWVEKLEHLFYMVWIKWILLTPFSMKHKTGGFMDFRMMPGCTRKNWSTKFSSVTSETVRGYFINLKTQRTIPNWYSNTRIPRTLLARIFGFHDLQTFGETKGIHPVSSCFRISRSRRVL